ncbi:MAG TPA: SDR family oxidoreductase [Dehalococcoidia bacterium]|nr:SDR family oxidoreductase [Dehalococcoidia bacterium]
MTTNGRLSDWALILGASSGFGGATAVELARSGMDIFGVHLDLRSTLPNAEKVMEAIRAEGRQAVFFNMNAADAAKRQEAVEKMAAKAAETGSFVRVVLHSLAFGTLQPVIADNPKEALTQRQMEMTLDVMANSLIYWAQDLYAHGLLRRGSRIYAMTSSGSTRVIKSYGAVSAAKAALEAHIRQLAFELAPMGVTANAIRAGVTDTPALRRIPEGVNLLERVNMANPSGRATTPVDVARCIAALADERTYWMTGNVIGVDGGEEITV